MPVQFNVNAVVEEAKRKMAERMLRAAVFFQTAHKQMLNVPNTGVRMRRQRTTVAGKKGSSYTIYPNPSRPGEYPHKITGQGQSGVVYGPETVADVVDRGDMTVLIGHRAFRGGEEYRRGKSAKGEGFNYMVHLERKRHRLGYAKTTETIRDQMRALILGR